MTDHTKHRDSLVQFILDHGGNPHSKGTIWKFNKKSIKVGPALTMENYRGHSDELKHQFNAKAVHLSFNYITLWF